MLTYESEKGSRTIRRYWLCGIVFALSTCNSKPSGAPPGTIQTAQRLTIGFGAGLDIDSSVSVITCLNDEGVCGISEVTLSREDCHNYLGAEFTLDGVVITQTEWGGYSSGEEGCTYPTFKKQIPVQQLEPNGPHQLTLRIAGDMVSVAIAELFENRRIALTDGKLIVGSNASVVVEPKPTLISEGDIGFYYNMEDLNYRWCFAKLGIDCVVPELTKVPPDAWGGQGFSFPVPTNMPNGSGTLSIDYSFSGSVTPCPFAECRLFLGRSVDIANVDVMHP